ncbi:tetratricopeptide repeat protein [Anatilimnocola sp. NA78]|uniref:tetratricopeptide repeat protein n=1 Tax=Anatilimnocola sp. NA78 TaxID=3415683 RepID=UPI003CE5A650
MFAISFRALFSMLLLVIVCPVGKTQSIPDLITELEQVLDKAVALKKAGQKDEAEVLLRNGAAVLRKGLEKYPENKIVRTFYCEFLLELKEHDKALAVVEPLLEKEPNSLLFHWLKARALVDAERFPDAETAIRRVIELDPKKKALPLVTLATGLISAKRSQDARPILREACQADLGEPDAAYMLALLTFRLEMYDEWEKVLGAGIAAHAQDRRFRDELVKGLLKLKRLDELYRARLEIAKVWPDDADNEKELLLLAPHLKNPVDPQVHVDRMYALHAAGKYPHQSFQREQFRLRDATVVVDEFFAVTDAQPAKYMFFLTNGADKKHEDQVIVGSTAKIMAHLLKIGVTTDADAPYFVASNRENVVSYGIFRALPPYKQVRETVVEIFEGKRQPKVAELIEPNK